MTAGAAAAERARLAARLAHRLESSLLLACEAADRGDLDRLPEYLDELGSRARGLARCCAIGPDAAAALREAIADWMGPDARWDESAGGFTVASNPGRDMPEVVELGEPLVRLLALEAGYEVMSWAADRVEVRF